MQPPSLQDVYRARQVVYRHLAPTPLIRSAAMSEALGCEIYLKLETATPVGAFKVRGGLNLLSQLPDDGRTRGVITASTGNHGQSIAYAAKTFGVRAVIAAPEGANPDKVAAMRRFGAEVVLTGRDFDEARVWAQAEARLQGFRYVHPSNEPLLIAGVATASLEILEALAGRGRHPGSHRRRERRERPRARGQTSQSRHRDHRRAGGEERPPCTCPGRPDECLETPDAATWAEGVATRTAFELPLGSSAQHVDDIVLLSEEELRQGVLFLLEAAHQLAEPAGAAPAAAARKLGDRLRGRTVVLIVSGCNITKDQLTRVLTDPHPW